MIIDKELEVSALKVQLEKFWELSGAKIELINRRYDHSQGSPVFTAAGRYTTRGWTEWTQGFEYGSAILQYDVTGEKAFLESGRKATVEKMSPHVGHFGVHDHGFNNVSTYGNLLRLMRENRIPFDEWEKNFYELALKISGAVQAKRWTSIPEGGFIHSFNGPHSLFVDTIRTVRALVASHELGYAIWGEQDRKIDLLERALQHGLATARYSVFYGEGRDSYDQWGRTAHECVFNTNNGHFRCPNSQQGYTGFTTWTRGLAWAITGFAEQLEYLDSITTGDLPEGYSIMEIRSTYLRAAKATCDFFILNTPTDGIPYWDTGAPGLAAMKNYLDKPSDPFNDFEPVDSSAAAIAAQGLLRLGRYLQDKDDDDYSKYWQAGLTVSRHLLQEPYLSISPDHQGLLLHSIYHRPNNWDYIPPGSKIPYGESSMWGDYHLRELGLYLHRILLDEPYYTFFSAVK